MILTIHARGTFKAGNCLLNVRIVETTVLIIPPASLMSEYRLRHLLRDFLYSDGITVTYQHAFDMILSRSGGYGRRVH